MTFDWSAFLHLAEALESGAGNGELEDARYRSAISRAYYAAFCSARDHLRHELGHDHIPRQGAHEYVRRQFQGLRRVRGEYRVVGAYLRRLHVARAEADYNSEWRADLSGAARIAIADCRRVLQSLEAVRSEA
jgi:uncharacterized protein (UPF0332 family)